MSDKEFWVFRIVHEGTGKPAHGVPVTVLDRRGDPAGYWVSEADGCVAIPRRDVATLRLRIGLRNEEPIELSTATLSDRPTDLPAPSWMPLIMGGAGETAVRGAEPAGGTPPERREPHDAPGHVIYFQRLAMFGAPDLKPETGTPPAAIADYFGTPVEPPPEMRYGVLIEVEEFWQPLGLLWGEVLYSASLTPGDEAKLQVLDGRWRRELDGRERPLQILARMVGTSMLGDLVTALRPELQLEPLTLAEPQLEPVFTDTVRMIRERTERMSHALRHRPLGVVDARGAAADATGLRTIRNTTRDRLVTFHFFEPLERYRVTVRSPRIRPVIFVPFRVPNLATPDVVRRFGYIFNRTLLDRALVPELDRLLAGERLPAGSRLFDHITTNLLYYSTAIIAAGDPAARHEALAKLRDPAGRRLTDVIENTVVGRLGATTALPLRFMDLLPAQWRDALNVSRPPRITEEFVVTIPHPGVWVSAQAHEPMQQLGDAQSAAS